MEPFQYGLPLLERYPHYNVCKNSIWERKSTGIREASLIFLKEFSLYNHTQFITMIMITGNANDYIIIRAFLDTLCIGMARIRCHVNKLLLVLCAIMKLCIYM